MPSWKKIIVSGSDAELNQLTATSFGGDISGSSTSTGSFGSVIASDLTEDRLTLVGANGQLTDSANFTLPSSNILKITGGSSPELQVVSTSVNAAITIDKKFSYRDAFLRFRTNGVDNWYLGTVDADNYGDGDEFYIGTGTSARKFVINPDASADLLTMTGNLISGSASSTGSFGQIDVLGKNISANSYGVNIGDDTDSTRSVFKVSELNAVSVIENGGNTAGNVYLSLVRNAKNSPNNLESVGGHLRYDIANTNMYLTNRRTSFSDGTKGNLYLQTSDTTRLTVSSSGDINFTNNISGSSTSTGSFGKLLGDGSDLTGIDTDLLGDTSPQLGGNLDLNSNDITGTGNIDITGNITAQNFIVSSSVTSITYQSLSGSTIFGDDTGDTHSFTGSLQITGGLQVDNGNISGSSTSTGSFGKITAADRIEVNGSGDGQVYIGTTAGKIALHAANDSIIKANHYHYTQNHNSAIFLGDDNDIATRIHGQNHVRFTFGAASSGYDDRTFFKVASRNSNTYVDTLLTGSLHITGSGGDLGSVTLTGNVSGSSTSTGSFGKLQVGSATIQIPSNGFITMGSEEGMVKNTRFGAAAGANLESGGTQNVLIGEAAGAALTTGDKNVVMGVEALKTETGGQNNTAIGYRALKTLNQNSVGGNIALGLGAGEDLATGAFNILIGYGADTQATDDTRSIVIGSEDTVGLGDNTTVIGGASQTLVAFGGPALISGSSTSTGSFGHLMVGGGNFTSASLASAVAGSGGGGGSGISNVVEDTSPQLGGDLDLNSNDITGTGNINIAGNLTVLGTTSTISTTNIKIGDPFGFFATGSAGTNVDGGIIIQSGSAVDSGSAMYHDISTERWSVAKGIASTATTVTDSEWQGYVATVYTSSGSPVGESPKYGVGEIHIDENGDIFIYS